MSSSQHIYKIRPRKDRCGVDLISGVLPFARQSYIEPNAVSNAKFYSRLNDAVIRVYDETGNVIAIGENAGDFKEPWVK